MLTYATQLERCLETFNPNIITLDMDMPLRTGLEVLAVLTPRGLDARVIIISGTPPNHERGRNPRVGNSRVFAIMPKPVRRTELREMLEKAMDQAQIAGAFSF